jgi:hypothetical protein
MSHPQACLLLCAVPVASAPEALCLKPAAVAVCSGMQPFLPRRLSAASASRWPASGTASQGVEPPAVTGPCLTSAGQSLSAGLSFALPAASSP